MNSAFASRSLLMLVSLLAACTSVPTRVHSLRPIAADGGPSTYEGLPLRVAAVHLPAELDRIEIVSERLNGELQINDADHWTAPLSRLAQQTLSADLLSRLPPGKVAFPLLNAEHPVAELRVDILRLPAAGRARVAASWQLTAAAHSERSGVVDLPDGSRSESAEGVVQGLSKLLGQLADKIAIALAAGNAPSP